MTNPALEGHLDEVRRGLLRGWALDPAMPDDRISLLITADGVLLGRVLANRFRPHLHAQGRSDGRHGFELHMTPPLSPLEPHVIAVRREHDGAHLPGSPVRLAKATTCDPTMQLELANILTDAADLVELQNRLTFLAAQTEALLQRHADLSRSAEAKDRLAHHRFRWNASEAPTLPPARTVLLLAEALPRHNADNVASTVRALYDIGLDVVLTATNRGHAPQPDLPAIIHEAPWVASVEETLARQTGVFDAIVLCTSSLAVRYTGLLRHYQPQALLILLLPQGLRHSETAVQAQKEQRPELLDQAAQLLAHEQRAIRDVDIVVGQLDNLAALAPGTRCEPNLQMAFAVFSPARPDNE